MAVKKEVHEKVLLQCQECRHIICWPLSLFVKQLGRRYQRDGEVTQFCECQDNNVPHVIVGMEVTSVYPRTAAQVFRRAARKNAGKAP